MAVAGVGKTALNLTWSIPSYPREPAGPSQCVVGMRQGGAAGEWAGVAQIPSNRFTKWMGLLLGALQEGTAYEFTVAMESAAGLGASSPITRMVKSKESCRPETTCSGHGNCTAEGGCVCHAEFYPSSDTPVETGLCFGSVSHALQISPSQGCEMSQTLTLSETRTRTKVCP